MDNTNSLKMTADTGFAAKAGYSNVKEMAEALRAMSIEDVREVDPTGLMEYKDIRLDDSLSVDDRIISLLAQTRNPYCFKYNGMIVKTSFAGKQTIEECLSECFFRD